MADTEIGKGTYFVPKDNPVREALGQVYEVGGDGTVKFYPQGGGFQHSCSGEAFRDRFMVVSRETVRQWAEEFSAATFIGDWDEKAETPLVGYSNGSNWNGWEVPWATREAWEKAIADGILGSGNVCFFDQDLDAFIRIGSQYGDDLPPSLDRDAAIGMARAALADDAKYEATFEGIEVSVEVAEGRDLLADGRKVHAYNVGDGFCWSRMPEPEPDTAPRA